MNAALTKTTLVAATPPKVTPAPLWKPLPKMVTVLPPASGALARVGFWSVELQPFGPLHAYVAPVTVGVMRAMVAPTQYGPPLLAAGVAGMGLTTTFVEPAAEVQPFTVMVTEYVPAL